MPSSYTKRTSRRPSPFCASQAHHSQPLRCVAGSPQAAPRMAMWRVRSPWRRCGASACSLAGPSSSGAGAHLRWTSTARRYARARGCRWQTRSGAKPLAWPRPVAPLVWLLRPGRLRRILLRRAWLRASPARTAAGATRWLDGVHAAVPRRAAFGAQEPCLMHAWRSDWNVSQLPCFDAARFAPAVLRHLTDPLHETSQCFR